MVGRNNNNYINISIDRLEDIIGLGTIDVKLFIYICDILKPYEQTIIIDREYIKSHSNLTDEDINKSLKSLENNKLIEHLEYGSDDDEYFIDHRILYKGDMSKWKNKFGI